MALALALASSVASAGRGRPGPGRRGRLLRAERLQGAAGGRVRRGFAPEGVRV